MQNKLQALAGLGKHYMVLIIGLMLALVLAGGFYAIREAVHSTSSNSRLNTHVDQATGRPSDGSEGQ